MEGKLREAYRDLEGRMKALAESEGDVYLPNAEPLAPVDYILVCMEPSLGHWARSADHARARVASGFRNFLAGIDPMLLHFSVRRFLLGSGERYFITDFSKGAMLVKQAGEARGERYDRWYDLLMEEMDLIARPAARVIAVGTAVAQHLRRRNFPKELTPILHYSPLAGRQRTARLKGHEHGFREFESSISTADFLATAREVLDEAGVPPKIHAEALTTVARSRLSRSRLRLIYCYKLDFEALRRKRAANSSLV